MKPSPDSALRLPEKRTTSAGAGLLGGLPRDCGCDGRGRTDETAHDYSYRTFKPSATALAGLEKALLALGLLARDVDLRNPHQDFFDPIWRRFRC